VAKTKNTPFPQKHVEFSTNFFYFYKIFMGNEIRFLVIFPNEVHILKSFQVLCFSKIFLRHYISYYIFGSWTKSIFYCLVCAKSERACYVWFRMLYYRYLRNLQVDTKRMEFLPGNKF